ncbi:MAG: hypothetical protein H0U71_05205 [Gammaproteobacteria bacterium]|nr:hypothetical protein [Gammaproteobacteria bacterium]
MNLPKGRKIIFSFQEAAGKYLERQLLENARNLKAKIYQLRLHLIPFFSELPLNKISSFDVERYKKFRLDNKVRPTTVNRELAVLSHLFTKAIE